MIRILPQYGWISLAICVLGSLFMTPALGASPPSGNVHVTYHWHMEQPIYWPAPIPITSYAYQKAWDSINLQNQQGGHPESDLTSIFADPDRVAGYQYQMATAIDSCSDLPDMGAQVSFSGELVENLNSLADNGGQLGYSVNWNGTYAAERQKLTSGGKSKMDLVAFAYHHPLGPLCDRNALKMEIEIHRALYPQAWGHQPSNFSLGFFPSEMAFSERMIPTLVQQGIQWVIVANIHLSRACAGYPYSPSGDNMDPPNPADQVNPSQANWWSQSISRGCTPNNAYPFAWQPHYAQYVDPVSGNVSKIIVVPADMVQSWWDGYECIDTGMIDQIAGGNDPAHPMIVLLAHDGDNDFGGGYTYYTQCVTNLMHQAASQGYVPSTIQQYLSDFPVDPNDIVHVEDGAWVNADGDFGSPQMINWNWPLTGNGTAPDFNISNGWQVNERNWAVLTAAQNYVDMAEQVSGGVRPAYIQNPTPQSTKAELAWQFYLATLNSGYMYYGAILDFPVKQTIGCNVAINYSILAIKSNPSVPDLTPPSIWYVMRFPYNPGGYGMGSLWNYKYTPMSNNFYIYTFAYDVSGIRNLTLYYRVDSDGRNPLEDNTNEMINPPPPRDPRNAVGPWVSTAMTRRSLPPGNEQGVDFFVLPQAIADEYYVYLTGLSNVLIDYYIVGWDVQGNSKMTDMYHCFIGNNTATTAPPTTTPF